MGLRYIMLIEHDFFDQCGKQAYLYQENYKTYVTE